MSTAPILVPCHWAYLDGKFIPSEQALFRADNHALHYGTAAFESFRVYETPLGPGIVGVAQHLKRLKFSLFSLGAAPANPQEVEEAISGVITRNCVKEAYLRLLVYPAGDCARLDISQYDSKILLLGWQIDGPRFPAPLSLTISGLRRAPASCQLPRAKLSGFYAAYASAHVAARAQGFDDALILHNDGTVCEVTGANVFLVKDSVLLTPILSHSIEGVTRSLVIELAAQLGITTKETIMPPEDLMAADEAFITGTFYGIRAVSSVAGCELSLEAPGPITRAVQLAFDKMLNEPESEMARAWIYRASLPEPERIAEPHPRFRVRAAQGQDVARVIAGIESLLAELRGVSDITLPAGAESVCLRTIGADLPGAIFVAELTSGDDHLIGLVSLTVQEAIHTGGPYALIQDLWVHQRHRSHGVGAALIEAVENYCRKHELTDLEVCLPKYHFAELPRTSAFYRACGFSDVGPRMRKELK
ncbi:MAG: GNAT family N-acetyltransferase [Acidobacteriota bacterium]